MKQRLEQKQLQKLILSQSLKQSIELMQYSQQELEEKLIEESKENPFLKIKKKEFIPFAWLDQYTDIEATEKKQKAIENIADNAKTLYSHLLEQLDQLQLSEKEIDAAKILLTALDENGFLSQDPEYLLKPFGLSAEEIYNLRKKLASLDPYGCCAINYMESLIFQLELKTEIPESKDAILLLSNFESELEQKDFTAIKQKTGFNDNKLNQILSLIRTLNPFPGRQYAKDTTVYIQPDVYVFVQEQEGSNEHKIEVVLNDKTLNRIEFNKDYIKQVQQEKTLSKEELAELRKKYYNAQYLIYAIQQRNETLLNVTKSIVNFQKDFFITGKNLHALKLKDVAEDIGVHESTVSRITTHKYVYTKWGIYELKYFFRRGLRNIHTDDSITIDEVKRLILKIVENEDKTIPLKDQEILQILLNKGIKISRRTIAKYRKELGILPSSKRMRKNL